MFKTVQVVVLGFIRFPMDIVAVVVVAQYGINPQRGSNPAKNIQVRFNFGGLVVHQVACKPKRIFVFIKLNLIQ